MSTKWTWNLDDRRTLNSLLSCCPPRTLRMLLPLFEFVDFYLLVSHFFLSPGCFASVQNPGPVRLTAQSLQRLNVNDGVVCIMRETQMQLNLKISMFQKWRQIRKTFHPNWWNHCEINPVCDQSAFRCFSIKWSEEIKPQTRWLVNENQVKQWGRLLSWTVCRLVPLRFWRPGRTCWRRRRAAGWSWSTPETSSASSAWCATWCCGWRTSSVWSRPRRTPGEHHRSSSSRQE